jgi:hypothetical protein
MFPHTGGIDDGLNGDAVSIASRLNVGFAVDLTRSPRRRECPLFAHSGRLDST